jgi:large subunit ribosomal protein L21e
MVKRTGGMRRKTRQILQKHVKQKGKISITKFLNEFKDGEKVVLKAEPAYVGNGMYHPMFHGKAGVIKGKKGFCYEVEIKDGSIKKKLIVHAVHLKKMEQQIKAI